MKTRAKKRDDNPFWSIVFSAPYLKPAGLHSTFVPAKCTDQCVGVSFASTTLIPDVVPEIQNLNALITIHGTWLYSHQTHTTSQNQKIWHQHPEPSVVSYWGPSSRPFITTCHVYPQSLAQNRYEYNDLRATGPQHIWTNVVVEGL